MTPKRPDPRHFMRRPPDVPRGTLAAEPAGPTHTESPLYPETPDPEVTVTLASIPSRVHMLERVVASLSRQAARVIVVLNGYDSVPSYLYRSGVEVRRSQNDGDFGDAGKFGPRVASGYHLTADDDIEYPPDYVREMKRAIDRYDRGALVSFHGGVLPSFGLTDYWRSQERYHCAQELLGDRPANVLGTGCMGYHTDIAVPWFQDGFPVANMADVWVAIRAQRERIPMVVAAHPKGWIVPLAVRESIYAASSKRDGSELDVSKRIHHEIAPIRWRVEPLPRPIVVALTTCNRARELALVLSHLRENADRDRYPVDIRVYDDHSNDLRVIRACDEWGAWFVRPLPDHAGKRGFWRLWDAMLDEVTRVPASIRVFLPDDYIPCAGFFRRLCEHWDALPEESRGALNLAVHRSREWAPCWTGVEPRRVSSRGYQFVETGWVDGMFACGSEFRDRVLLAGVPPIVRDWDRNPALGSGVGQVISARAVAAGLRMYRPDVSLVSDLPSGSRMNPESESRDGRYRHQALRPIAPLSVR